MQKSLRHLWYNLFAPSISKESEAYLLQYSSYYRQLNAPNQQRFQQRLALLLKFINFLPQGIPTVLPEMKIIIGSAIIQITFGLKSYIPQHFEKIYVLPGRYRFRNFEEPFLGHIDVKARVICFSWADVQSGFKISDDAVNVALHEMAHVWETEDKMAASLDAIFDKSHWKEWEAAAKNKLISMKTGDNRFLKNYGAKNLQEMFAVCVEAFFEQADLFKAQVPELYESMVNLLQQNPLNKENPLVL